MLQAMGAAAPSWSPGAASGARGSWRCPPGPAPACVTWPPAAYFLFLLCITFRFQVRISLALPLPASPLPFSPPSTRRPRPQPLAPGCSPPAPLHPPQTNRGCAQMSKASRFQANLPSLISSGSAEGPCVPEEEDEPSSRHRTCGQRQAGARTERGARNRAGADMRFGETKRGFESKSGY